jgi:hypothetical protein
VRRPAFLLALVLGLAACSGSGNADGEAVETQARPASAQAAVAAAGEATQGARSARVTFTATLEGGAAEGTFTGEGAFTERRGRMTMDLSGLGGGGAFGSGKLEVIFDRLVVYLRFPPEVVQGLPGARAWLKIDLAALGAQQGIDFEQLLQLNQSDPTEALVYLRAAGSDFREVGTERVRGAETTRYRGTIDLRKVAAQAPAQARKSYERVIELSGKTELPMDVWIDEEGLARRIRFEQRLPNGAALKMTQELYDFGADVDVELPPADQVTDLTELIGNA